MTDCRADTTRREHPLFELLAPKRSDRFAHLVGHRFIEFESVQQRLAMPRVVGVSAHPPVRRRPETRQWGEPGASRLPVHSEVPLAAAGIGNMTPVELDKR
jgi:hypothetical protein